MSRSFELNVFRPVTSKKMKHHFVGFDIETQNDGKDFVSLALYSEDGETFFTRDPERAAKEMVRDKYIGCTFVATNLTFDFCGVYWNNDLWNRFSVLMKKSGDFMCCSYAARQRVRQRGGKEVRSYEYIRFLDTFNFVPYSVKKLGEVINLPKINPPSWLGERAPENASEWEEYRAYNVRDAEISCKFMRFWEDSINDLGADLKTTAASTAMNLFQRKYLQGYWVKEKERCRVDPEPLIRDAYYGGRTETFKRGRIRNANYYDINSLYPSVMKNPFPLPQSAVYASEPNILLIRTHEGVSRVRIRVPDKLQVPLLPIRHNKKLVFPRGEFTAAYNHVELRAAERLGYEILDIYEQVYYKETIRPFDGFVDDLYTTRMAYKREGNPMQLAAKLMMNSLYGRFAMGDQQRTQIVRMTGLSSPEISSLLKLKDPDSMDSSDTHVIAQKTVSPESPSIFPIMSSYATSYARLRLYEFLERYDPIYCDTDSIITMETIPTSDRLGDMKLEMVIDDGIIIRAKLYKADDYIKAKGMGRLTEEQFSALLEHHSVDQFRVRKPRTALKAGLPINEFFTFPKTVDLEDDKRVWSDRFNADILQNSVPLRIET